MSTKTVTVNAAFFEEIKADNESLRALLTELDKACRADGPSQIPLRRLASLFGQLRDQLAMHFSLEEAYGYFDEPVFVAAHLSQRADRLRKQHAQLYEELAHIVESAEELAVANGHRRKAQRLAKAFLGFFARFQEHERLENELIAEAYNVDIGVGD